MAKNKSARIPTNIFQTILDPVQNFQLKHREFSTYLLKNGSTDLRANSYQASSNGF